MLYDGYILESTGWRGALRLGIRISREGGKGSLDRRGARDLPQNMKALKGALRVFLVAKFGAVCFMFANVGHTLALLFDPFLVRAGVARRWLLWFTILVKAAHVLDVSRASLSRVVVCNVRLPTVPAPDKVPVFDVAVSGGLRSPTGFVTAIGSRAAVSGARRPCGARRLGESIDGLMHLLDLFLYLVDFLVVLGHRSINDWAHGLRGTTDIFYQPLGLVKVNGVHHGFERLVE